MARKSHSDRLASYRKKLDTSPFTDEEGDTFTHEGGTPSREKGHEVLASRRVNNKEALEGCENNFSLPSSDAYIVNPFLRQSDGHVAQIQHGH